MGKRKLIQGVKTRLEEREEAREREREGGKEKERRRRLGERGACLGRDAVFSLTLSSLRSPLLLPLTNCASSRLPTRDGHVGILTAPDTARPYNRIGDCLWVTAQYIHCPSCWALDMVLNYRGDASRLPYFPHFGYTSIHVSPSKQQPLFRQKPLGRQTQKSPVQEIPAR